MPSAAKREERREPLLEAVSVPASPSIAAIRGLADSRWPRRPRIEQIVEAIAKKVQSEDGQGNCGTGKQRDPPGDAQESLRVVGEVAPAHAARVAEPDEA